MRFRFLFVLGEEITRDPVIAYDDVANGIQARISWSQIEQHDAETMDDEEWIQAQSVGEGRLELYLDAEPPRKARPHLVAAAQRRLPEDETWSDNLSGMFLPDGSADPKHDGWLLTMEPYNNSMRVFLESLRNAAVEHATGSAQH